MRFMPSLLIILMMWFPGKGIQRAFSLPGQLMTSLLPMILACPSHIFGKLRFLIELKSSCGSWKIMLSSPKTT
jgi:hypothetical protein